MNEDSIQSALKTVKYPGFSRDIVSFGLIRNIHIQNHDVTIDIALTTAKHDVADKIKQDIESTLRAIDGIKTVHVNMDISAPKNRVQPLNLSEDKARPLPGIKHVIAIASGKGGVGKSTFSVNLACAIKRILTDENRSNAVGIMDCDIYGPSIPLMMGIHKRPQIEGDQILPIENFGIPVMSMGFLIDEYTPVVWRGPMIMKTIQQFATHVQWGDLELLVVDLPPGTGDAQLSLVQTISLRGAVVVTTPQLAAVQVARRGATMFNKVNVPILGVVENMSYLTDASGNKQFIFGQGGGPQTAKDLHVPFLGQVPLDTEIREGGDRGIPIVISNPQSVSSQSFYEIANQIIASVLNLN